MRTRVLIVAVLAVAALLWWFLRDDELSHRVRNDGGAQRAGAELTEPPVDSKPVSTTGDADDAADSGTDAQDEPAREEPPLLRGRVQVLGREDVPLEGVRFTPDRPGMQFARPTDMQGWTEWEGRIESVAGRTIVDSLRKKEHDVELPITTIRFPDLIPLEVEFIDAQTGVALEDDDSGVLLPEGMGRTVYGRTRRILLVAPIEAGELCEFPLHLDPPERTTGEFGLQELVRAQVSRRAHTAHLRIPLWPECQLILAFRDAEGSPLPGVQVEEVELRGQPIRFRAAKSDGAGRTQIFGVPYFYGARLQVRASGRSFTLGIRRASQVEPLVLGRYARGGIKEARAAGRAAGVPPLPDSLDRSAKLDVELRWFDRDQAGDVPVLLSFAVDGVAHGRTVRSHAESGIARFDRIPPGDVRVVALDPALAYEERTISLREKGETACTIGPAQGRAVTFVAQRGEPVPGARLHASSWFGDVAPPIVNGVQELSAVTGPQGEFQWHGFPTSKIRIVAKREVWQGGMEVQEGIRDERHGVALSLRVR